MIIRKANAYDLDAIVDFQLKMAMESEQLKLDVQILRKGVRSLLDDSQKGFYHLAETGGQVIGCHAITYEWSDWRNQMWWWIQSLYIEPKYRNRGVFRSMYETLQETIRTRNGLAGIRLYVDRNNHNAQEAYRAIGMDGEHYTVFEWTKD